MPHLPFLLLSGKPTTLPLAESTAESLVDLLLQDAAQRSTDNLKEMLREDPVFFLWAVLRAQQEDATALASMQGLSEWMLLHLTTILQWPDEVSGDGCIAWESTPEVAEGVKLLENDWANAVKRGVALAEGARQWVLAETGSETETSLSERAYHRGLLYEALRMLVEKGLISQESVELALTAGLFQESEGKKKLAEEIVRRVVAIFDQRSKDDATGELIDWAACQTKAKRAREKWTSTNHGKYARWLPRLAARMGRLALLESEFAEVLQREKLEAMAEFAAGAGHEINNPLTVIAGRAQVLLSDEKDADRRRTLAMMNYQAMRVYEMIADMMLFARPPLPKMKKIDLAALLPEGLATLVTLADAQKTTIGFECNEAPLYVKADPTQITIAVRALCQNALEAIGEGGKISIRVERMGNEVRIVVEDQGPGLTAEELRHAFDPFYSARQAGRGLGVGLSKAWRIVTNHGGEIEVHSLAGEGALFTIKLPQSV